MKRQQRKGHCTLSTPVHFWGDEMLLEVVFCCMHGWEVPPASASPMPAALCPGTLLWRSSRAPLVAGTLLGDKDRFNSSQTMVKILVILGPLFREQPR